MACIIVSSGVQKGLYLPLGGGTVVIGRDEGLFLQIDDEQVSRKHMKISCDPARDGYSVTDLNSSNGTTLNGRPLGAAPAPLAEGDTISLGGTSLLFTATTPTDRPSALEVLRTVGQRGRSTIISND